MFIIYTNMSKKIYPIFIPLAHWNWWTPNSARDSLLYVHGIYCKYLLLLSSSISICFEICWQLQKVDGFKTWMGVNMIKTWAKLNLTYNLSLFISSVTTIKLADWSKRFYFPEAVEKLMIFLGLMLLFHWCSVEIRKRSSLNVIEM